MSFETAAERGGGFQASMVHSVLTKLVKEDSVEDWQNDEQERCMRGKFCWDVGTPLGSCFARPDPDPKTEPDNDPDMGVGTRSRRIDYPHYSDD